MAEKSKISASIDKESSEWLKLKKQVTGESESSSIQKGLDIVKTIESNEHYYSMKIFLSPIVFFVMGTMLFLFGIFFYVRGQLSTEVFLVFTVVSSFVCLLAMAVLYHALKLWVKTKGRKRGSDVVSEVYQ